MADDLATARRFGYGALTPGEPEGPGRLTPRPAVVAVVDYEPGDRFAAGQDAFLDEFFNTSRRTAGAMLAEFGAPLSHVGGGAMPPIIQMSAAEHAAAEEVRVNLVGQRLVHEVFGPRLFGEHPGLVVICADNFSPDGGANRTAHVSIGPAGLTFPIAFFSHHASLQTRLHEVLHTLGGIDVYGDDKQRNVRHSLMSSCQGPGGRDTKLPDPWHRMAWRLTRPDVRELTRVIVHKDTLEIPISAASGGDYPALLLWSDSHGDPECLIVELRNHMSSHGELLVDSGTAPGFVVWSLQVDANGVPVTRPAAPPRTGDDRAILTIGSRNNLELGGWDPWLPSAGATTVSTPELRWLDGSPTGFSLDMQLDRPNVFDRGVVRIVPVLDMVPERRPDGPGIA